MTDQDLVSRVLEGDRQAFQTLIRQNEKLVASMVGRLVAQQEDREEICQDVFMRVYEKIGEFQFQSRLSTWIATIAYRHAVNHLRKKKADVTLIPEDEKFADRFPAQDDLAENLAEEDMERLVLRLIEELPIAYKSVLTLYHLQHMSYAEIGEITQMPEGTVKNYLFRARNLLKNKVKMYLGKEERL